MFTQQTLTLAVLATSIVSMLLSMIALWPQWKDQLAVLRDFVLWTALAVFVIGLLGVNWRRSVEKYNSQETASPPADYASFERSTEYSKSRASNPSLSPIPNYHRGRDFLAPITR